MMANEFETDVDETGRLILPPGIAQQYGLKPGAKVRIGAPIGRRNNAKWNGESFSAAKDPAAIDKAMPEIRADDRKT